MHDAKYPALPDDAIAADARGSRFYAVHPDGHVVGLRAGTPLKPGWRLAGADDIANAEALEDERIASELHHDEAPAPADEHEPLLDPAPAPASTTKFDLT